jgi:peptide/nickel transport system ATP-binding protein
MLKIQNLQIRYGDGLPVVDNFSLALSQGEIVSIVGASGSGKTSVIRAIMGLLPIGGRMTSGDILLEGQSLLSLNKEQWRDLRGTRLSMIFQDFGVTMNPIRRIGSQYTEYIRTHEKTSKKEAWQRAARMLQRMRLPEPANIMRSYPFQLSGGMRQRVGIAMAMTFNPKLLLADEPTSALDVTTQAQIVRRMMALRDEYGTSIIMVTHNLGVAVYMSDRIIVMKDGAVVDAGDRDTILHHSKDDYTRRLLEAVPMLQGKMYV